MPKSSPRSRRSRSSRGAPPLHASVAELRALAHPLRLRLLERFAEQPRTTKQVAELLGLPPTRLYHHVAALERAGLLVLRKTRPNRGAIEKWYEAAAHQVRASPRTDSTTKGRSARRAVAMTLMEQSRQDLLASIARPGKEPALLLHFVFPARTAAIPAIRQRLVEAIEELEREAAAIDHAHASPDDSTQYWGVTVSFAPTSTHALAERSTK